MKILWVNLELQIKLSWEEICYRICNDQKPTMYPRNCHVAVVLIFEYPMTSICHKETTVASYGWFCTSTHWSATWSTQHEQGRRKVRQAGRKSAASNTNKLQYKQNQTLKNFNYILNLGNYLSFEDIFLHFFIFIWLQGLAKLSGMARAFDFFD